MKKLNVKLLAWVAALTVLLGVGVVLLHSFQAGRIARALLWQAGHSEDEEQLDVTAKFLARYLELEPGDNEERAHLGRILADPRMATSPRYYQRALFVLEQVVTREPERAESRRLLARMALKLTRYSTAEEHLLVLLKNAPKDGDVLDLLGQTYQGQGKHEEAKGSFQKAIEAAPGEILAYQRLARLLRRHPDKADADQPRDPDAVIARMVANNDRSVAARLARWNDTADAGLLTRVGTLLSGSATTEGGNLARLDDTTRAKLQIAEKDMARALELGARRHRSAPGHRGVGADLRPPGECPSSYHQARRLLPDDPRPYRHLAAVELAAGKSADALKSLGEGIKAVAPRLQGDCAGRWPT